MTEVIGKGRFQDRFEKNYHNKRWEKYYQSSKDGPYNFHRLLIKYFDNGILRKATIDAFRVLYGDSFLCAPVEEHFFEKSFIFPGLDHWKELFDSMVLDKRIDILPKHIKEAIFEMEELVMPDGYNQHPYMWAHTLIIHILTTEL